MGRQLDMTRKLLGDVEYWRQVCAGIRSAAREIAAVAQLQIIADEGDIPLSSLSQGVAGANDRDVQLGWLPYFAKYDTDRKLGNAIAALWGCEMTPLPEHSPVAERLIAELEKFGEQGEEAIQRAVGVK